MKITKEQLSFLMEKEVETVCFGAYSAFLHFEDRITITIESSFQHLCEGENENLLYDFPLRGSNLMRLITSKIVEFHVEKYGTLELFFSNGDKLIVHINPGYESYHAQHGDDVIHV